MNCSEDCDPKPSDDECSEFCYGYCPAICKTKSENLSPPSSGHSISTNLIIMACVLGGAFILGFCWIFFLNFYSKWKISRRRNMNSRVSDDTHEDFLDGNHGPMLDHPIWYINTVGLQQSIIDSITVCKFKKDDGLFEGTECSVCLSEFEEDESVRLLPKCDHAFHLHCIDTWLRSHKNCPLCRAPIVRDENASLIGVVSSNEANSNGLGSREDTRLGNSENREGGSGNGENGSILPIETGRISKILERGSSRNSEFRVQSDLVDNRRAPEQDLQQVRRSVSLDSSTASVIYRAMANVEVVERERSSNSLSVQVEKNSNLGKLGSTSSSSGSSSIYKMLMKSSSIGRSFQKKPISMKRSFSSSGKISASRHSSSSSSSSRISQTSILPL